MAMTVVAYSHKTLLGLDRICIRFSRKPASSTIQAVKTFGAKYRKAKDAPPCWYLPADKVDVLAQHLGLLDSGEEVDQLSAALAPFLASGADGNAEEVAPEAEVAPEVEAGAVDAEVAPEAEAPSEAEAEAAPEEGDDGMPESREPPRKRLRVTDSRQVRECRACVYEAQMMAQDVGGFAQMYHTCVESESQ